MGSLLAEPNNFYFNMPFSAYFAAELSLLFVPSAALFVKDYVFKHRHKIKRELHGSQSY